MTHAGAARFSIHNPFAAHDALSDAPGADDADAALVARCQAGEREAFGLLLRRYRDRVVSLAYHLLRSREDAEDAAQEAFTQAFSSINSFRGESQFWTWLYRITVNLCLHRRRRARPCESLDEQQQNDEERTDAGAQAVTKLMVERTLDQLSPPLRVVLILRETHDLGYEEIAAVLNIPVGTVRSRLSAARLKFRQLWQDAKNEEEQHR